MKETRIMMGMTITVEIADKVFDPKIFKKVFDYFEYVDQKFSMYKPTSEISHINKKEIKKEAVKMPGVKTEGSSTASATSMIENAKRELLAQRGAVGVGARPELARAVAQAQKRQVVAELAVPSWAGSETPG